MYNNINFGRPWSGWGGTNVVQPILGVPGLHNREIGYEIMRRRLKTLYGWAEPGARIHVYIIGTFGQNLEQWVQVDASGQWNLIVNNSIRDNTQIEIYQVKEGYINSKKAVYFIHKNGQNKYYPNLGRVE